MTAFISHSFENKPEFENVTDALELRGVTFWNPAEIRPGASLREQVSLRERESAVSPLLRFLAGLPPGTAGELQSDGQGGMENVKSIRITRGNYPPGPHFQVEAVRSIADPIVERLQSKYTKRYETRHPTHLLAYYDLHPASPPDIWLSDARDFVRGNWATAPFVRVWIMDAREPRILLDLSPETIPEGAA